MAARVAVVSPLVGGNAAYLRHGENALVSPFEDVGSTVRNLEALLDADTRQRLVDAGEATCAQHTLERERSEFASLLSTLDGNYDDSEEGRP
jgi:glycosyltransferase involved in cell wall biosynthesis